MKHFLLFIVFILQLNSSFSANDSILFSKNGAYVLEKNPTNDFLNGCKCHYWKLYEIDKNESTYTVVFENDSVYFLHYEQPGAQTGRIFKTKNNTSESCTTLASIFKVVPIAQYESEYQFSSIAVLSTDTVAFTSKTINTHSEASLDDIDSIDIYDDDSTLYFDINILLAFNGEKVINDTISTNIPKIEHHYKVYYSEDTNFYFVKGWYSYTSNKPYDPKTNPGRSTAYFSSILNKIGKKKKTG